MISSMNDSNKHRNAKCKNVALFSFSFHPWKTLHVYADNLHSILTWAHAKARDCYTQHHCYTGAPGTPYYACTVLGKEYSIDVSSPLIAKAAHPAWLRYSFSTQRIPVLAGRKGGKITHQFPGKLRPPYAAMQPSPSYYTVYGDLHGIRLLVLRPEDKTEIKNFVSFPPWVLVSTAAHSVTILHLSTKDNSRKANDYLAPLPQVNSESRSYSTSAFDWPTHVGIASTRFAVLASIYYTRVRWLLNGIAITQPALYSIHAGCVCLTAVKKGLFNQQIWNHQRSPQ